MSQTISALPHDTCDYCQRQFADWSADDDVWKAVMEKSESSKGYICFDCFSALAGIDDVRITVSRWYCETCDGVRAEPPTDGDRRVTRDIIDALDQQVADLKDFIVGLHAENARLTGLLSAGCGLRHDVLREEGETTCRECGVNLVAAEPPSAPAPCPTNHTLKAPSMAGNTQVGFVYIPYKSRFCPDCGAFLGTPEGQKEGK